jgi:hypothetical protein
MTVTNLTRIKLLKEMNAAFSAANIKKTAKIVNALPDGAHLSEIAIALNIIPHASRADWRKQCQRIPVLIADGLMEGTRAYLRNVNKTKGTRVAGTKAITTRIVDGKMFALVIAQEMDGMHIKLTMRNQPLQG